MWERTLRDQLRDCYCVETARTQCLLWVCQICHSSHVGCHFPLRCLWKQMQFCRFLLCNTFVSCLFPCIRHPCCLFLFRPPITLQHKVSQTTDWMVLFVPVIDLIDRTIDGAVIRGAVMTNPNNTVTTDTRVTVIRLLSRWQQKYTSCNKQQVSFTVTFIQCYVLLSQIYLEISRRHHPHDVQLSTQNVQL